MFKVGDRVVVVRNKLGGPNTFVGQRGVVNALSDKHFGIGVRTESYGVASFFPEELEFEETYDAMSAPHPDEVSLFSQEVDTRHDDVVNSPSHYTRGKFEVIDIIEDSGVGYRLGNVLKYVLRCDHKHDDNGVEDLSKALWYLKREILSRGGTV
ncbi:hypothetical protein SEA_IBANTIK_34 [Streptomyces phage Ibantik]|uniref:DUF3310 domain-containing protein n=1 Tax=Streptomyces phage Ibantik TaxID=2182397 RepID=A0A2U8UNS7_9CAUD|nr:hypothetical protein QEH36_gp034 [Streptomyces phage Ibantik]AWN05258.1 hypothetical protein SEA_IBANTIK_34 [Streptomyces phage Ibantik]